MDVIDDRLVTQLSPEQLLRLRCAIIAQPSPNLGHVRVAAALYAFVKGDAEADAEVDAKPA